MVLFASAVRVDLWVRGRGLTDFLSEQEDARLRGKLGYEPSGDEPIWDDKGEYRYRYRSRIGYPSYFFICLLAWPYVVATTIRLLFSGVKLGRVGLNGYDVRTAWLLTLSPVIYFALLAVANFALQLSDRANMG
jgi:hypothetical protein